jgi:hypothetical protein
VVGDSSILRDSAPEGPAAGWCERGELNPHGCPLDPKSSASASSATLAGSCPGI